MVSKAGRKRRVASVNMIAQPAEPVNKKMENNTHRAVMPLSTVDIYGI